MKLLTIQMWTIGTIFLEKYVSKLILTLSQLQIVVAVKKSGELYFQSCFKEIIIW